MPNNHDDEEVLEGEIVGEIVTVHDGALAAIVKGEIDSQIATARRFPRSVTAFMKTAAELITSSEEIAAACIYSLPRGNKPIEGPSARFAEILAHAWGNCRAGARVMGTDETHVTSQGMFIDLEKNVGITYETKRQITDKNGKRYKDDMITVTSNAASSIALRNAVLKGIPKALWNPLYLKARETAIGNVQTLASRRASMMEDFAKMSVVPDMIFKLLDIEGVDDIGLDELASLKGLASALKEGDTTIEQAFGIPDPKGSKNKRSKLNDELSKEGQATKAGEASTTEKAAVTEGEKPPLSAAEKQQDAPKPGDKDQLFNTRGEGIGQ